MNEPPKGRFEFSEKKRALFDELLKREGLNSSHSQRIPRRKDDRPAALSFAQQRLWFLDQLEPGNAGYSIHQALRLTGRLNRSALERTLDEIIRRHEALRTTLTTVEGQPIQVIAPSLELPLSFIDLEKLPPTQREEHVYQLAVEDAQRPFDLSRGPLFRASLLKLEEQVHVLLLNLHHIITDGWSMGILLEELAVLYEAYNQGKPSPLQELPVQYADFAVWQREWLQGEVLEKQLSYWRKQLAGNLPILEIAGDRPRPAAQTFNGGIHSFSLSDQISGALRTLSRQEGVTLFVTFLSAFKVLMHRYTQLEDILVGSPIANRNRLEIEKLIGFFVNTLVLRTDLSGNPTFRELLHRVREATLDAYSHQDLPFEKLVQELRPERDLSHSPLFQLLFVFQNVPRTEVTLPGLTVTPLEIDSGTANFDLSLYLRDFEPRISGALEYNSDLFDAPTISRMIDHFQIILQGIVTNPSQRLSEMPMLTAVEQQRLLVEWNATALPYPKDRNLAQLIEAQVERSPKSVAAVFENRSLSYEELNRKANQLAHYLRKLGVAPDILVGLCMERSLEMLIALLGILKAGGAYVPLDPEYPEQRLGYMLEDSRAPVLLTQRRLVNKLPDHQGQLVCLDTDWKPIARESSENPLPSADPEHLAYVIYTSGSTGKPKGVQISHRAVVNFLRAMQREPGIHADDILLAVTTISFDIAGLELYLPLTVGARVVIASREEVADGIRLAQLLQHCGATIMQATPATWRFLLTAGWEGAPQLKILCGGEALPLELAQQLWTRCASLWNLYGPTESTIWSTLSQVTPEQKFISIGRPIANTQIYILDSHLQPVPIGIPGELHIGGDGLGRGYLNRPELTAERFIHHPFAPQPGARLYKTGDLARYRPDGRIECVGRLDHQVKIRGFRIELGEIEAVLSQHPGVKQAVAIAREDNPGDKRLAAYLVANKEQEPTFADLRKLVRAKLPDYMVPSAFVIMDAFPLTSNGKVDRKALPPPEGLRLEMGKEFIAPRTAMEEVIAGVWKKVLGVQQVGIHDNFFDLGGHSLLSMKVVYEIERETGRRIGPREMIFQTLEQIALGCESRQKPGPDPQAQGFTQRLFGALRRTQS